MKTPDEIKKGLECCSCCNLYDCNRCPYYGIPCNDLGLERDALAYIQQLERERDEARNDLDTINYANTELYSGYEAMKRERDAAVEQLQTASRPCNSCKYGDEIAENDTVCKECKIVMRNGDFYYDHWQWRGAQEVE